MQNVPAIVALAAIICWTLVMAPKSVTFDNMITWCLCFLEICSAIPTTLHFQCFCMYLVTVVFDGMKLCIKLFEEQFSVCESMIDLCTVLADPRSECE